MSIFPRLVKVLLRTFQLLGVLIVCYGLAVILGMLFKTSGQNAEIEGDKLHQIYVYTNGLHASFVLPVTAGQYDWRTHFPLEHFPGADSSFSYISLGWGDRDFYLNTPEWSELDVSTTLRALFLPTPSIIQATYRRDYKCMNKNCYMLEISESQYVILTQYILQSIEKKDENSLDLIKRSGYTPYDRFYEATGAYSCINTCNNWLNRGLKAMSIHTALWSPLDVGIFVHLDH